VDHDTFQQRFREAAQVARDFARRYIEEELPDDLLFRVHVQGSAQTRGLQACGEVKALRQVWRDGAVPFWVNMAVVGEIGTATIVEVFASERFTADDSKLYHEREGRPPFHVLGPSLPVGFEEGQRFSIYYRTDCWTLADLQRAIQHAPRVWSLRLNGLEFDDAALAKLDAIEGVELLELEGTAITGASFCVLAKLPRLRVLRAAVEDSAAFGVRELPVLASLSDFHVRNLPPTNWGFERLSSRLSNATSCTFAGRDALMLDGRALGSDWIQIEATRLIGTLILPRHIDFLKLHVAEADDGNVAALLKSVHSVSSLDLAGTRVTENLIMDLSSRFQLRSLTVGKHVLSKDAAARLRAAHPSLRLHP
jgi:hypothetical protein